VEKWLKTESLAAKIAKICWTHADGEDQKHFCLSLHLRNVCDNFQVGETNRNR